MSRTRNSEETINNKSSKANNINIQINFNVKDKQHGFVGKKINNFIQIQPKNNTKTQNRNSNASLNKKMKKKLVNQLQKFQTPSKIKLTQKNKGLKQITSNTPQKKSNQKKTQKSRSKSVTNKKSIKIKAKSTQNLHLKNNYNHYLNKSPSNSPSKSKSRSNSKSSKKLLKSNNQSMKNIHAFTNSGIKNKIKQKTSSSKQKPKGDNKIIKQFIQQKKKKEKIQKQIAIRQQKIKKQKLQYQLKKVQQQRKANAKKPISKYLKNYNQYNLSNKPLVFDDNSDQFDEGNDYQKLNQQAKKILHDSPSPHSQIQSMPIKKYKQITKISQNSGKKHKKQGLVYKYLKGNITSKQMKQLVKNITKIQSVWRGYNERKIFYEKIENQARKLHYTKNRINQQRGKLQRQLGDNSITVVKNNDDKNYQSNQSQNKYFNYSSNQSNNFSSISNKQELLSDMKIQKNKNKKLNIFIEDNYQQIQLQGKKIQNNNYQDQQYIQFSSHSKKDQKQADLKKYIQELNKKLQMQAQQFKSLQEQNNHLKQSLKNLSLRSSRQIKIQDMNSVQKQDISIRMPKKIINYKQQNLKTNQQSSIQTYKKQLQIFQCPSPSSQRLQQQLKILKSKNIDSLFKKKQLILQEKYKKSFERVQRLKNDKLVSPRTYNSKMIQLQKKLKLEKEQINLRIQQAKRVVGFISDIQIDEEAPKNIKQQQNKAFLKNKQLKELQSKQRQMKQQQIKKQQSKNQQIKENYLLNKKKAVVQNQSSSYSSQQQRIYKKYWTDDIGEVHKHTLELTKRIQQAIKQQNDQQQNSQYGSRNSSDNYDSIKQKKQNIIKKHEEQQQNYEVYMEQIKQMPTDIQQKAKQIFNKIDLNDQEQYQSQGQLGNSTQNLCQILNQRPLHTSPNQIKQNKNLYISQAQYNRRKKSQQLSKSNSFQKSFSQNNSSIISKGFITNLTFIKQFCISVCEFIRSNYIFRQQFAQIIGTANKFNHFQYLKSYRTTINGQLKSNFNTFQDQYIFPYYKNITQKQNPISAELFNNFMAVYQEQRSNSPRWNDPSHSKKIKQIRQYFLISIVDAFNQSLQYEKPGGIYGQSMPWYHSYLSLKNNKNQMIKLLSQQSGQISNQDDQQSQEQKRLDQIFGSSIAKLIQWGSSLCGFIADPMPMQMGDSQIGNLNDEQLNSIRQNRIGLMLQKWLLQQQQSIIDFASYNTQVQLSVSQKIFELLLNEVLQEVSQNELI